MARAAITGQPLHTSSPLVASFLLLVGLAKVMWLTDAEGVPQACAPPRCT
jgi:Mg2+/citrate symporter